MLELKSENSIERSLDDRANIILQTCENLVVGDQASYTVADTMMGELKALSNGITEFWCNTKKSSYDTWQGIIEKEKSMLKGCIKGKPILAGKMSRYKIAFDLAEQKKRDALQLEAKNEARLKAFELAEQGVDPVAVEAVMEMAEEAVPMAPMAELRGKTSFKPSYEVRMIPGEEWRIPKDLLWPSTPAQIKAIEAKVKAQAKFTGGKPVDGFEIIPVQTARRRTI